MKSTSPATVASNAQLLAFGKFGLVGATTAAIYFAVVWFLDVVLGFPYIGAVSLAYLMSTVFHFSAQRHFVFAAASGRHGSQIARYLLTWIINYLITILVVGLCVEGFHLSPYIGIFVSVLFTMCVSYFLGRYWVFKTKEQEL